MAKKTRIIVQVDPSFPNPIYLRGQGISHLSWEKGIQLRHEKPDEWVFETDTPFSSAEFKVLMNDDVYEMGENHPLYPGSSVRINPKFPN